MIQFACPTCSQPLSAEDGKAGAEARCPGCGTVVPIPSPAVATPAAMTDAALEGVIPTAEEKQWGLISHLSGLIATMLSLLGFIGPLICWVAKKDTSAWVAFHAKEALNFQLNMLFWLFIAGAITLATCGVAFFLLGIPPLYAMIMSVIAAIQANDGKLYRYPAIIRVVT